MKTIYKLKEIRYSFIYYMTNEQAEKAYISSSEFPSRVSCGFYSQQLKFYEWIERYRIVIL